jgi:hypothetical protein
MEIIHNAVFEERYEIFRVPVVDDDIDLSFNAELGVYDFFAEALILPL